MLIPLTALTIPSVVRSSPPKITLRTANVPMNEELLTVMIKSTPKGAGDKTLGMSLAHSLISKQRRTKAQGGALGEGLSKFKGHAIHAETPQACAEFC